MLTNFAVDRSASATARRSVACAGGCASAFALSEAATVRLTIQRRLNSGVQTWSTSCSAASTVLASRASPRRWSASGVAIRRRGGVGGGMQHVEHANLVAARE